MDEFTQHQAAVLSGYDERAFRSLVEKRIILASPATRNSGRGKAKTFLRDEIRVASILNGVDHGLTVFQRAGVADFIRREIAPLVRSNQESYIIISTRDYDEGWNGWIKYLSESKEIIVPTEHFRDGIKGIHKFFAVNVQRALYWEKEGVIGELFGIDPTSEDAAE